MVFYAARTYTSTLTLSRAADVRCGKCECRYRYPLVRRGTGHGSAPYWIGVERAKRKAQERAVAAARRALAAGVEPVACPDCGWLQPDMCRELRRRAARPVLHGTWAIPLAAAVGLLFAWGWASHGFRRSFAEMEAAGQLLVLAVATLIVLPPVAVPLLRLAWVKRLDFNRDFPLRPAPVPGAPPAVRLADAGPDGSVPVELDVAPPDGTLSYARRDPEVLPGGWVEVQLLGLTCPPTCVRCLGPATRTREFTPLWAGVCEDCDRARWVGLLIGFAVALSPAAALLVVGYRLHDPNGFAACAAFAVAAGAAGGGIVVAEYRHRRRAVRHRRFDPTRNTVQVRFRNPGYTEPFLRHVRDAARQSAVRTLLPPSLSKAAGPTRYVVNVSPDALR